MRTTVGANRLVRVLGIMSGTSLDGVDYALCEFRGEASAMRLMRLWSVPFPSRLRTRLARAASNQSSSWELAQLHHDLGRFYAMKAQPGPSAARVDCVGLHGQTIFHHPSRTHPSTLQIGEPAYLAERLRVPVVSNFRAADLAAGGQGAPLATMFHQVMFARKGLHVAVNNLGGISNVTSIDWRKGRTPRLEAFDTGPANLLIDIACREFTGGRRTFDRGGAWAARGKADETLLRGWLKHPFFRRPPPKSTGREMFGDGFWVRVRSEMSARSLSREDLLASLTRFTAESVVMNYRMHLQTFPDLIILAGGGAGNRVLRGMIASLAGLVNPGVEVVTSQDLGWPTRSIEPAAFALLAWCRMNGHPGNLPGTTGARAAVKLGQVC